MIKSMTGFGRFEEINERYKISVEIKSVNHRYLDLNIKLPRKFNAMENALRGMIKDYAARGKVDVFITYEDYASQRANVTYHEDMAQKYMEISGQIAEQFTLRSDISTATLMRFPEVITLEETVTDPETIYPVIEDALEKAGALFVKARQTEGEALYQDIVAKLDYVSELVSQVEARSPEIIAEYREKIWNKVQELLGERQIDEAVLATELIVYSDKVCVDEETVRLRSHVKNMQETLQLNESVGRKLDFIAQEMNREANTILSKANDRDLSQIAINLKTEIEKIREQIQNIE